MLGTDSGASYVVFGKASGFSARIDLSGLNGTNGFVLSCGDIYHNLDGDAWRRLLGLLGRRRSMVMVSTAICWSAPTPSGLTA